MPLRSCRVSIKDVEGITHSVEIQAATLFEAAAEAVRVFGQQGWAAAALTPQAVLRIEVRLPTVVHDVPFAALQRWLRSPSASPKEKLTKLARR
jgi:hypothetical protein